MLIDKARGKFLEWQVAEKVDTAKTTIVDASTKAYTAAASSDIAAKSTELAGKGYEQAAAALTTVSQNPSVVKLAEKSGETASQLRARVADELLKLRAAGTPAAAAELANGHDANQETV